MKAAWQRHRSIILTFAVLIGNMIWYGNTAFTIVKPTLVNLGIVSASISGNTNQNAVNYDRLGIHVPMQILPDTSPLKQQDWDKLRSALNKGAGLAYAGDDFAAAKVVFVTAHSSDVFPHAYSSAFAGLHQAKTDDTFTLALNNQTYVYTVKNIKTVAPTDTAAFDHLASSDEHVQRAILVTCWPLYTTKYRLLVIGESTK